MTRRTIPQWPGTEPGHTFKDISGLPSALYCRVSFNPDKDDEVKETKSVDDQEAEGLAWAGRTGVTLAPPGRAGTSPDIYKDDDRSASKFATRQRDNFIRLREAIEAGRYKIVWFWSTSRQTRGDVPLDVLARACEEHGVLWCINGQILNPANDDDMLVASIHHIIDKRYSAQLSKDVTRGKKSSAWDGKPAGKVVYGYKRHWHPETGKWERDEPNVFDGDGRPVEDSPAFIVREIFDRILAGHSITRIRRDLNDRGIPTSQGYTWSNSTVRYIAMNPSYAGMRVYHIEKGAGLSARASAVLGDVVAKWPPLVDPETFWAVYRKLADPARKTTRTDRPGGRLLSAITRCGECGGKLTVHAGSRNHGQRDDVYACKERTCVGIYVSDLDEYVEEVMIRWLSDSDVVEALTSIDDSPAAKQARADADRARGELKTLYRDVRAGKVSPAIATCSEEGLRERITEAEQREQAAVLPPVLAGRIGEQAAAGWDALDNPVKRQIIAAVADIRLHRVERHGTRMVPAADRVEWRWLMTDSRGRDAEETRAAIRANFDAQARLLAGRRSEVGRLRAAGWSRPKIAGELGIGVSTVAKDIAAIRDG